METLNLILVQTLETYLLRFYHTLIAIGILLYFIDQYYTSKNKRKNKY